MKILAFTDTHGSPSDLETVKKKAKNADIIICAGDFTIFENEIEYVLQHMNSIQKKVLLIHGNHEDEITVKAMIPHFKNLEFIHKKIVEIGEYAFVGYGGGGFATRDAEFEIWTDKISKKLQGKKVILVVHGPPYGTKVDLLGMGYAGNKSFTKVIKKEQPKLVICGHLHETFGKKDKINNSIIINPGPEGEIINI
ncbi:metallophosphoesterase [Bacteroidota bacterium]